MAKGYWVARIDVTDPNEYQRYVAASAAAFTRYKGVALARGGHAEVMEGAGRGRNVVWEFPSFQDAVDCYNSPEYRAARAFRKPVAVGDIVIVEGVQA